MQLIVILLATVGILTFLSGAIVFFGSSRSDRARSAWFFAAATFATLWMTSIAVFLAAGPDAIGYITPFACGAFISAILLDAAFLGYGAWGKKYGKILTILFLIFGLAICATVMIDPGTLVADITLANMGNSITINIGPLYIAYVIFFCTIVPAIIFVFFQQYLKARAKRKRSSGLIMMVAFGISSTVVLISDLVLPLLNNWSAIWLGPIAIGATILVIYYMILRYHTLMMSLTWLKIFSYIVVVASLAIIYMIIFSIIFAALFRGSTPSIEVIVLNFIMILIFIALTPAMSGLVKFIRSLILEQHPRQMKKLEEAKKAAREKAGTKGATKKHG